MAVMLNDRKQVGDRGRPFPSGGVAIIRDPDEPDGRKGLGKAFGPPWGKGCQSLE